MHLKRWITAVVLLPFLILLLYKGSSFLFAIVVSILSILALWEYFGIVLKKTQSSSTFSFQLLAYIIGPILIWAAYINSLHAILGLITLNLIISGLISMPRFKSDSFIVENITKQNVGIIYIPFFLACLVFIRNGTNGAIWIFFLLCIIFAGDTGAYYVGSYLGKHKLCPAVSPGKTIEGSIGGLAANLGIGALFKLFFLTSLSWTFCVLLPLTIGIVGQIGDLFESELKRSAGIKDSGVILPGHGGVLDRVDALLFAAPVAYFFKEYFLMNS